MGTIVLCRHAATEANLVGRFLSRDDPRLSEAGRAQSERLREQLASLAIARALSSPKRRCLETLAIAAPSVPVEIRPELVEIDFGDWEGETRESLALRFPEALEERYSDPVAFRHPGGESFEDVAGRVEPLVREIERLQGPLLVVAHRGTLGVFERLLRGLPLRSPDVIPLEPATFRVLEIPSSFRST